MNTFRSMLACSCLLMAVAAPSNAGPAQHTQSTPDPLARYQITISGRRLTLDEIVSRASRACGCSIVVNDRPLRPGIDLEFAGPLSKLLAKFSDAFDYDYRTTPAGVILLTKRFQDPNEYPNIPRLEAIRMAQDMSAAASGIDIDPDPAKDASLAATFNRSLTTVQLQQLKRGGTISVGGLDLPQQWLIEERIARSVLLGGSDLWSWMTVDLESMPASSLQVVAAKGSAPSTDATAIDSQLDPQSSAQAYDLQLALFAHGVPYSAMLGSLTQQEYELMSSSSTSLVRSAHQQIDASDTVPKSGASRAGDALAAHIQLDLRSATLSQVAAAISNQTGIKCDVPDYLSEHRLTVQIAGLTTKDALDALAQIGGWKWRELRTNEIIIEKPPTQKESTLAAMASAMQNALTPDIRRFLGKDHSIPSATMSQRASIAARNTAVGIELPLLVERLQHLSQLLTARLAAMALPAKSTLKKAAESKLTLSFRDCTRGELELVMADMLVYDLRRCATQNPLAYRLLMNELSPYQMDPKCLSVSLRGNSIDFSTSKSVVIDGKPFEFQQHIGWKLDVAQ